MDHCGMPAGWGWKEFSKRRDCPYRSGRGKDWLKAKCTHRQELGIAGYLPRSDNARAVGALVLAYYEDGTLTDAGRVGTGFTPRSRRLYGRRWLRSNAPEFAKKPRTGDGLLRAASFKGLREDKDPSEVRREDINGRRESRTGHC
jgi:bifunctional non-homologous end joining protein LigD